MNKEEILSSLVRSKSQASVQNTFMRLTDKEVAVSLMRLDEETQNLILGLLPPGKTERIHDEMRLFSRRIRIPEAKYLEIINHTIAVLQGRSRGNISSFIKPKKL